MNPQLYIFDREETLFQALWVELKTISLNNTTTCIAIPGGKTPRSLFRYVAKNKSGINWSMMHWFWGDERCVPASHPDSNYKMAYETLLSQINIPTKHIHRIRGEADPHHEVKRYAAETDTVLSDKLNEIPRFDWILLGVGSDGHTASLFPDQAAEGLYIVAEHPQSGQKRISMNYVLINSALRISFVVMGGSKKEIVSSILLHKKSAENLPAAQIQPFTGRLDWYLDAEAAALL